MPTRLGCQEKPKLEVVILMADNVSYSRARARHAKSTRATIGRDESRLERSKDTGESMKDSEALLTETRRYRIIWKTGPFVGYTDLRLGGHRE